MNYAGPGFSGMARQRQHAPLGPEWAAHATNIVVDSAGRLGSRKGWDNLNATPIEAIIQTHQFINAAGTTTQYTSTGTKIYSGTSSLQDRTNSLTFTAGNWKFLNFNGYCLGWQAAHTPIVATGTTFTAITAATGTLPDGNAACAAFGRIWALDDDKQTIRYCALLDHTKWATADGGGTIDMRSVWTRGMDEVVAIIAFGSSLAVFGKRHIVVWVDGSGSELGLSPTNMYVSTVLEDIGLVARDAICQVGELDVVFWSHNGIRSLSRTMQEQAAPARELSAMNRDYLAAALTGTLANIRMVYAPTEGLILVSQPAVPKTYVFDVRAPLEDGSLRMTEWTLCPSAWCSTITNTLLLGTSAGYLGTYGGYDDNGTGFQFHYESGWVRISEDGRRHSLKALRAYLYAVGTNVINFKWWVDFKPTYRILSRTITGGADEWGIDEWGVMQWGLGQYFQDKRIPLAKEAEYFKLAIITNIGGTAFAVQPLTLYTESTRLA